MGANVPGVPDEQHGNLVQAAGDMKWRLWPIGPRDIAGNDDEVWPNPPNERRNA